MTNTGLVHSLLFKSATQIPDQIALVQGSKRINYQQLWEHSIHIAYWLIEHSVGPGDRVALLTEQSHDYVASYFGTLLAGAIAVGLNTQTSEHSLETVLSDCGASVVLSHKRYRKYEATILAISSVRIFETEPAYIYENWERSPDNSKLPDITPDNIAQLIYTSGTTGAPKGVMLRHRNLVANTLSNIEYLELTPQDKVMAVLPFFYSYGNSILLSHIAVGGTLVVNQSFLYPNVILDQMVKEGVTGLSGVPSTFAILLNRSSVSDYTFPSLRYLTQAGAPMAPALASKLTKVFPDTKIFIMYGQTEAAPRLSYLDPHRIHDKAGSIGKAIPGVTLEVCRKDGIPVPVGEVGEIVASGDNIMAGYWNQPEETSKVIRQGKLWTGDLARKDEDGFLYIEGRKSTMIKSGSHRIAPKEIEAIIMQLEEIHEVAVVGKPDEILGEKIVAFIVLKTNHILTEKEVIRYCRKFLPIFKAPHKVVFKEALPKTSSGKIKTRDLQDD